MGSFRRLSTQCRKNADGANRYDVVDFAIKARFDVDDVPGIFSEWIPALQRTLRVCKWA
jgi:hypothetical protein